MTKSYLGTKRFISACNCQMTLHPLREPWAGTIAQDRRTLFTGCCTYFLTTHRTIHQPGFSHQSVKTYRPAWQGHFPSPSFLLQNVSSLCQVDINQQQTQLMLGVFRSPVGTLRVTLMSSSVLFCCQGVLSVCLKLICEHPPLSYLDLSLMIIHRTGKVFILICN